MVEQKEAGGQHRGSFIRRSSPIGHRPAVKRGYAEIVYSHSPASPLGPFGGAPQWPERGCAVTPLRRQNNAAKNTRSEIRNLRD
jgi:hypothetical protein